MKEGILPQDIQDKRYSFSRFKRVMQRPPLNEQESAMLAIGIIGGALVAEGATFIKLLDAVNKDRSIQEPLIEGVAVGLGLATAVIAAGMLPVAINRGWGQKEAPIIKNPHSTDTSTKAIASYLKSNWKQITTNLGVYGAPLIAAPTGLLLAVTGHDVPANILMWGSLVDVSIIYPLVPVLAHRKKN